VSNVEPRVQQEDERRGRRFGWWLWVLAAVLLIGAGFGSYAGGGGFSGSSAAAHHHGHDPVVAPSGGSSSGSGSGSGSAVGPAVAAGSGGLPTGALLGIPPSPVITSEPTNPTTSRTAAFSYRDAVLLTSFRCSLDGSTYSPCGTVINLPSVGAITYNNLSLAQHCFSVEGVTALLLVSVPTTYCWQINGVSFSISWTPPSAFYPGTSQSANLVIHNPNPQAITIASGGINIAVSSDNPTVCASSNFAVTQGLTGPVTIPANTTESLSAAGLASSAWPVVTMYDGSGGAGSHTNQDSCEGVGLTFTFSGTASGS
jgi:hypothetical protein